MIRLSGDEAVVKCSIHCARLMLTSASRSFLLPLLVFVARLGGPLVRLACRRAGLSGAHHQWSRVGRLGWRKATLLGQNKRRFWEWRTTVVKWQLTEGTWDGNVAGTRKGWRRRTSENGFNGFITTYLIYWAIPEIGLAKIVLAFDTAAAASVSSSTHVCAQGVLPFESAWLAPTNKRQWH